MRQQRRKQGLTPVCERSHMIRCVHPAHVLPWHDAVCSSGVLQRRSAQDEACYAEAQHADIDCGQSDSCRLQVKTLATDSARRVNSEAMPWHQQPEVTQLEPAKQAALDAEMQQLISSALEGTTGVEADVARAGCVCDADGPPGGHQEDEAGCTAQGSHARKGTDRSKPRWALTAAEADKQIDVEDASLLQFAENLDFDAYASSMNDAELAAAIQVRT